MGAINPRHSDVRRYTSTITIDGRHLAQHRAPAQVLGWELQRSTDELFAGVCQILDESLSWVMAHSRGEWLDRTAHHIDNTALVGTLYVDVGGIDSWGG